MPRMNQAAYDAAKQQFADWGVDTDAALATLKSIPISLHCWQGDDVGGFEVGITPAGAMTVTGNYPGRARSADELRADLDKAYSLIPGKHRLNLHAIYAETNGKTVDRDAVAPEHFARWIDWAKAAGIGVDFNPSFFAHPKAADGFTLASADAGIRDFWIEHGRRSRTIAAAFAKALGTPAVNNVWIPDGYKDTPFDRKGPRERLEVALDKVFAEKIDDKLVRDAVEGKLFAVGLESYTVGSHEFYLGYAIRNKKLVCLDAGHYHPTEQMADKISSVFTSLDEILLHVSRGVRWDSDHVVTLNDDLLQIAQELVRGDYLAPHAHRPGFLRCQHQPHRCMGHRHAKHAQSPADRPVGARRPAEAGRELRRPHRPPGVAGRDQNAAGRCRLGRTLPPRRRSGRPGVAE